MGVEIERRFLIHADGVPPDGWWPVPFEDSPIVQTYLLNPNEGVVERVRLRVRAVGVTEHTHTLKRPRLGAEGMEEIEGEVSPGEYAELLERTDPACVPVPKVRRVFTWPPEEHPEVRRVFELDTYAAPFEGLVVLEVELPSFDAEVTLPPFLPVVREITKEKAYSNFGLAKLGRCP